MTSSEISLTVTVAVAVFPFEDVAVIVAVPFATPVTTPFETFATPVLLDVHVIFLSVAFDGETFAVSETVSPFCCYTEDLSSETDVTAVSGVYIFWKPFTV